MLAPQFRLAKFKFRPVLISLGNPVANRNSKIESDVGHGIGRAIRTQSDDLLKVETGSLYPALHRLVKRGWLKSEWGVSEANQRARYYELTPLGRAQLAREHDRWTQLVTAIGRIMNPAPSPKE